MPRRRYDNQLQTVSGINITPLMDLTFLLLIVFMITAPVLEFETDVSPPEMSTDAQVNDQSEPLMINLNREGDILFQRQIVSLETLTTKLEFHRSTRPDVAVLIRADGNRPYKEVIDLMKAVRKASIRNVSLVTQPET